MKNLIKKNIDTEGRILRLAIAILLFILALVKMSWVLLIAALFVLFESVMSWCVVYQMLGKNSCPIERKNDFSQPVQKQNPKKMQNNKKK